MTPPGGSGVSRVISRELQREAVADHHVAVLPREAGGTVADGGIEQRPGRKARRCPTARDPRRRRSSTGPAAGSSRTPRAAREVGCLRAAQVDREQVEPPHRM